MKLEGKVAIVTGTGPRLGMGRKFPIAFAKEGAKVALIEGDITKEETVKNLVETTMDKFCKIDILLNNAAISTQSYIKDMPTDMWDRMIEVNLKSVVLTTRYVVFHMIPQKFGRIINIASQLGQKDGVEHSHYAAAKARVKGFAKSIALELGQHGITANCITPGLIEAEMM